MSILSLSHTGQAIRAEIPLASSKSESNRALIMQALAQYQANISLPIENLSAARDTQTLQRLLQSKAEILDVLDAGTAMRFLTAYCAVTSRQTILTGTVRMCARPIGILVDALRSLGFSIEYLQNEGFPPFRINHLSVIDDKNDSLSSAVCRLKIRSDVSSQYISALLMIAPLLPNGLHLQLEGKISSQPYILMTLKQMEHFGIVWHWEGQEIRIEPQSYQPKPFKVESDWSGASYWYSITALAQEAEIELLGLREDSLQGDKAIVVIMAQLGVQTQFTAKGALLTKIPLPANKQIAFDFSNCPDLAQTVVALTAVFPPEYSFSFSGLESLRIKETDRIQALQNEVAKFGRKLIEKETNSFGFDDTVGVSSESKAKLDAILIQTYDDHRMAMAFAPLALRYSLRIEHPEVVVKSYPSFWEDLARVGFLQEKI
jgi:3-phosphoshikimate 1-carboxyvinyltransferase